MQTKLHSLFESLANVIIGFVVAFITQLIVFPMYGLPVSLGQNVGITCIFTVVSVLRSYLVRRLFNAKIKRVLDPDTNS